MGKSQRKTNREFQEFASYLEVLGTPGMSDESVETAYLGLVPFMERSLKNDERANKVDRFFTNIVLMEPHSAAVLGMTRFLDAAFSNGSPSSLFSDDPSPFTFTLVGEFTVPPGPVPFRVDSTEKLRASIAGALNLDLGKIAVYPHMMNPDLHGRLVSEQFIHTYIARNEGQHEDQFYDEHPTTELEVSVHRAFSVTVSAPDDVIKAIFATDVDQLGGAVALPYTIDGVERSAEFFPLEIGRPFSVLRAYAFVEECTEIDERLSAFFEQGHSPAEVGFRLDVLPLRDKDASSDAEEDVIFSEPMLSMQVFNLASGEPYFQEPLLVARETDFAMWRMLEVAHSKGISRMEVGNTQFDMTSDETAIASEEGSELSVSPATT